MLLESDFISLKNEHILKSGPRPEMFGGEEEREENCVIQWFF